MVDHRARKQEIIAKSIRLFAKVGYRDVTFAMISANCGVARTVLYRYFRDKRQIFDASIVACLQRVVTKHREIVRSDAPVAVRLHHLCMAVSAALFDNRDFLCVVVDFVLAMKHEGYDMSRRIKKFTFGLKRVMHTLLLWGRHRGEFVPDLNPDVVTDLLYAQFESAVLRLVVSDDAVQTDLLDRIDVILKGLVKK